MSAPEPPEPTLGELLDERLRELHERHRPLGAGASARYYTPGRGYSETPWGGEDELFAISFVTPEGEKHSVGDHERLFPLQSLSKVFTYVLALQDLGRERVLERVGVAPSGEEFSAIEFDERHHRPHNPMVNAGALVTTELVRGTDPAEKLDRILEVLRACAGNPTLAIDEETLYREGSDNDHNRAVAYLMRSQRMLLGDVEDALSVYLGACSVMVTSADLAVMGATLALGGVNPVTGERVLTRARTRDVLTVMYTCGMYDFAGEWAFDVGVPAKSSVSGGVLAAIPEKMGVAVFSPGLDEYGNSVRGTRVCQDVSVRLGLHVFATEDDDVLLDPAEVEAGIAATPLED
ncbi:MAG: glutaminase A [Solirubrobacterales bacterium]|nr:glutaminase A [Solirubrobacterales bacterium]